MNSASSEDREYFLSGSNTTRPGVGG